MPGDGHSEGGAGQGEGGQQGEEEQCTVESVHCQVVILVMLGVMVVIEILLMAVLLMVGMVVVTRSRDD